MARHEQHRRVIAIATLARPASGAGLGSDSDELAPLLRRVTLDQTVTHHRRTHVRPGWLRDGSQLAGTSLFLKQQKPKDSGIRYMSRTSNPEWLRARGLDPKQPVS